MSTIFELIDAGDPNAVRERLAEQPDAAAAHDDQGLTVLMRGAYRGGDMLDAVRAANPPLEPFDRIMVGETEASPLPTPGRPTASRRSTSPRLRTTPKLHAGSSKRERIRTSCRERRLRA